MAKHEIKRNQSFALAAHPGHSPNHPHSKVLTCDDWGMVYDCFTHDILDLII